MSPYYFRTRNALTRRQTGLCRVRRGRSFAAFTFATSPVALAEDSDAWTIDITKQHPPIEQENRIIRWCSEDGTKHRFASANIEIKGYAPCGELKTAMACDPAGKKLIAPDGNFPNAYRDCSVGPRITIKRHDDIALVDGSALGDASGSFGDPSGDPKGLSPEEQKRLEKEFTQAQAKQEEQMNREIQQALQFFTGSFGGGGSRFGSGGSPEPRPRGSWSRKTQKSSAPGGLDMNALMKALSQP